MSEKTLQEILVRKRRFNTISLLISFLLVMGSIIGISWIAGDGQRTIFGSKINLREMQITNDKYIAERIPTDSVEARRLQAITLKYLDLSLGQNYIIRQLFDLGFFALMFWNGFYWLVILISDKQLLRNVEIIHNE